MAELRLATNTRDEETKDAFARRPAWKAPEAVESNQFSVGRLDVFELKTEIVPYCKNPPTFL